MSRSTGDRLRDIIQSTDLAAQHTGDLDAIALAATVGPRDATLFRIAIACEAASRLPVELQALAPEIPWGRIRSMRNHIVHGYWQIDFKAIVDTIQEDLEPLKNTAQRRIELVERTAQ
jgi:uncharacterized protein with HEPN domain